MISRAITNTTAGGLDRNFAAFIARISGDESRELYLGALLVSARTGSGDICLDITSVAGRPLPEVFEGDGDPCVLPDLDSWITTLKNSPAVGQPGNFKPLILDPKGRLYLYRYWRYEQGLASAIALRVNEWASDADMDLLRDGLERFFPAGADPEPDWQRIGAMAAVLRRFCVISGGPGTGKTSTVVKILALLAEQALAQGREIITALAAPTGKAAARLQEAITRARENLPCSDETRRLIPEEAATIHRLLKPVYGSPYFHHNARNPLPHDVVVVDESSMADMALMAKLAAALRPQAWLILLGDRDQLSSVESGAVLGDICGAGSRHEHSATFRKHVKQVAGISAGRAGAKEGPAIGDSIIVLKKSYRFGGGSGIGALGGAVRDGDPARTLALLKEKKYSDIALVNNVREGMSSGLLAERISGGYGPYITAENPAEVFNLFNRFTVLCALRQGPLGVEGLNAFAERALADQGIIEAGAHMYRGRPVMISRNDYMLRLFNGDVGIILPDESSENALRAFFPPQGPVQRKVLPAKLPEHETVYAMTVHKSQGSEFDNVLLILPDNFSPVLTRELVYTAITRARLSVEIWADEGILRKAVENPIRRTSGLRDALWGE